MPTKVAWRDFGRPRSPPKVRDGVLGQFWDLLDSYGVPDRTLAVKAGYGAALLSHWRSGIRSPFAIRAMEDILGLMGYELVIRRKREKDDDTQGGPDA